ncbi:hypothetical protein [Roseibium sp. RKSG952]|uniref:hypothetical protein n=1 Tax=Roseibium sp. RKSG952 TaxID=2529384 RepID=UPI0012BBA7D3|nr:hypothetical protein [Roseibium sp. RKSG952]MTH96689.1 hypothetical protein [Roseibium sp. RKSG952]
MDFISMMKQTAESVIRGGGLIVNVALLGAFMLGALFSYDAAIFRFERAGGLPDVSVSYLLELASSPDILARGVDYLLAWLFACACVGLTWMSILGARWFYHACLRTVLS